MADGTTPIAEGSSAGAFENPFRGLRYYRVEDEARFFGRASESRILVGHLRTARLTLLYAESGVGKSSLLRAGVAAALVKAARRSIAKRGTPEFVPVVFNHWKGDPLANLITAIESQARTYAKLVVEAGFSVRTAVPAPEDTEWPTAGQSHAGALAEAINSATEPLEATMVIILDQFEELFANREHTEQFATELAACINDPAVRGDFLIAVREDAYGKLGDLLRRRVGNVYGNYFHLGYLTREAAREAIEGPVRDPVRMGEGLTEAVLEEVRRDNLELGAGRQSEGGPLPSGAPADEIEAPFLQLVMERLWEKEQEYWRARPEAPKELRHSTLEGDLGGAETIVAEHFDRALRGLSAEQRGTARKIFSDLVTPSGAKVAITAGDLAGRADQSEAATTAVLEALEQQRIVRQTDPAPGRQEARWELFHDRLGRPIQEWGKEQERLSLAWEAEERAREARRFQLRSRVISVLAVVCLALLGGAIGLWQYAISQKQAAVDAATTASALALGSNAQLDSAERPDVALLLALAAYRLRPTGASASAMTTALEAFRRTGALAMLNGNVNSVNAVAFSRDGRLLASGGGDGTVRLWSARTHREIGAPLQSSTTAGVVGVAFTPDGSTVASAGGFDPTVRLWDVRTHTEIGKPLAVDGKRGYAYAVAVSPDGRTLAAATESSSVGLWNVKTRTRVARLDCGRAKVASVAFSPDGRFLACGGYDKHVWLWSLIPKRRLLARLAGSAGTVYAVGFSRTGTLASAAADGTLQFWSVQSRTRIGRPLQANAAAVNALSFSPDGATLAAAGSDGTVRLWSGATRRQIGVLRGHAGTVLGVTFDPRGDLIASAGADRTLRLWQVPAPPPFGANLAGVAGAQYGVAGSGVTNTIAAAGKDGKVRLWDAETGASLGPAPTGRWGAVRSMAFSPDGRTLAFTGHDGNIHVWDVRAHTELATLGVDPGLASVAVSPDGRMLASGDDDGRLTLWDLPRRSALLRVSTGQGAVKSVAFSREGGLLASGGTDHTVRLWDARNLAAVHTLAGPKGAVYAVAFSPNGRILAAGATDARIRLWNIPRLDQQGVLAGTNGAVYGLDFSPDGRVLASGGSDDAVRLWDVVTGIELGSPLSAGTSWVNGVAFTAAGQALASVDTDSTVRSWRGIFWNGPADLQQEVCTLVGMGLSRTQWTQYAPGIAYHTTCPVN